jgi:RNA polymerase sigma-70 factor (ECF subfamily)
VTASGQQQIFQEWLDQYQPLLFKIVRAYGSTTMDRDDLFQEIAIQVWRSVPSFRQLSSVKTWIYRVALNTAIKWAQQQNRRIATHAIDELPIVLRVNEVPADERLTWLYEEINRLDVIDRSLTLLLLDGFSYREMAGILGITENNVGVKINRIKKHLITQSKKGPTYDGI